ncbi:aminotransferase class I/II-fold pyridoxal phosphate-dependent enzyme [Bradyrhizobium sp. STM 3562]|uniref:aminotransferase class I/II-fold pyridoxal phosphate-dependent enzyme n=1 Tax=Bradyrhizobium sp. STM 3562 TaxID=578924 RepID=UPI00388F2653
MLAHAVVQRGYAHVHGLSDNIYEKLTYSADFVTITGVAPGLYSRILTVNGPSNADAISGWRVGCGVGPLIKAMSLMQGQTSSHASSASQYPAIEALSGGRHHVDEFANAFEQPREPVAARLNKAEVPSCRVPDGGFYIFLSCAGVIGKRALDVRVTETETPISLCICSTLSAWPSCPAAASWRRPISTFPMPRLSRTSPAPATGSPTRAVERSVNACCQTPPRSHGRDRPCLHHGRP